MNRYTSLVFINKAVLILLVFVIFQISACQPNEVMESVETEFPVAIQTSIMPTKISTTALPTQMPTETPLPTDTATITPTPRPILGPENPATSIENVAGKWAFKAMGGGENDPAILTLTMDGLTSIDAVGGYHAGMNLGTGTYWFEDDVMVLYSEYCDGFNGIFTCTAKYKVYFKMGENRVGSLRFIAIEDPHQDRKKSLHGKTFFPADLD